MNTKEMWVLISGFSGLIGALLTQLMTGLFSYINDKRKFKSEQKIQFHSKKTEIGENFYFMNGEIMTVIQKNIAYWKNKHSLRGQASISFLNKEMEQSNNLIEKLNAENWKYNLINIYYDVPFSYSAIQEANLQTHQLYLKILDMSEKLKNATGQDLELLYTMYNEVVIDLCLHYELVYLKMQDNMTAVKTQLLASYHYIA